MNKFPLTSLLCLASSACIANSIPNGVEAFAVLDKKGDIYMYDIPSKQIQMARRAYPEKMACDTYYDMRHSVLYVCSESRLYSVSLLHPEQPFFRIGENDPSIIEIPWYDELEDSVAWLSQYQGKPSESSSLRPRYDRIIGITKDGKLSERDPNNILFVKGDAFNVRFADWETGSKIVSTHKYDVDLGIQINASKWIIMGKSRDLSVYARAPVSRKQPGIPIEDTLLILEYKERKYVIFNSKEDIDVNVHDGFFLGRGRIIVSTLNGYSNPKLSGNWYFYRSGMENVRKIALRKDIVVHWAVGDTLLATDRKHLLEIDITSDTPREVVLAELPGEIEDVRGVYPVCATMQGEQE